MKSTVYNTFQKYSAGVTSWLQVKLERYDGIDEDTECFYTSQQREKQDKDSWTPTHRNKEQM